MLTEHPAGYKGIRARADLGADHDVDVSGDLNDFKDDLDFQAGFYWNCCKGSGNAKGCAVLCHKPDLSEHFVKGAHDRYVALLRHVVPRAGRRAIISGVFGVSKFVTVCRVRLKLRIVPA